mgnify:FL=1|jgi:CRP/FNR family transcriptional regulator, cyclic AMP receptor protein
MEAHMKESKFLKENTENLEKLLIIPGLQEFDLKDLGSILRRSKIRQYDNEEQIIQEGDHDALLFFLLSGGVRIEKGGKKITVLKRRGDMFGEMSIIDSSDRTASAFAEGKAVCLTTDASKIEDLSKNDRVAFGYILYRIFTEILAERLRKTTEKLIKAQEKIEQLMA